MKKILLTILWLLAILMPSMSWAQSSEAYAVLSEENTVLTFYYDGQKGSRTGTIMTVTTGETRGWYSYRGNITSVTFDNSFADYTGLTSTDSWFNECSSLTSITGLGNLNTGNVTDMSTMFRMCTSLTSIDLSNFSTSSATDLNNMFFGCSGLESLDLGHFDTQNVQDMHSMFAGCEKLTSLDLSNFNTTSLTNMQGMFSGCDLLEVVDLSSFNTSQVTDVRYLFNYCPALTTVYVGSGWDMSNVTDNGNGVFNSCTSIVGGEGTTYDASHVDYTYAHIDGGASNPGYFTNITYKGKVNEPYAVLSSDNTTLTFYYDKKREEREGMLIVPFEPADRPWNDQREDITSVVFDDSFANCTTLTSTANWFWYCHNLTTITGISNLKTDNVTNMSGMFYGCRKLTSLDVSGFVTQNVTDMSWMFYECYEVTTLDVTQFDTHNVTDMSYLFTSCMKLTTLDVSGFNTANVTNMTCMFADCNEITSIDVSHFNTANVTSMNNMFQSCYKLASVDVSGFNTANVTTMASMFISCREFTSLDLSSFNTANVANMGYMFAGNHQLSTIYVGSLWSTAAVTNSDNMFDGSTALIGGAGTVYDADHIDATYAHIDGGPTNPGYLTDKDAPVPYAVLSESNTILTFYYDKKKEERNGMSVGPFSSDSERGWHDNANSITTVVFDDSFSECTTLTSTAFWFRVCQNLVNISGLSNLKTDYVTSMRNMFYDCGGLTTLDLSSLNTSNVSDMFEMFCYCGGLTTLNLNGLNTTALTNMSSMFYGCTSLTSLDLSSFNTSNVVNMGTVFSGCSNLKTIYVGSEWSTASASSDGNQIFLDCYNIIGGAGTVYDADHTDYTYAHIDGGTDNPGYFTRSGDAPYVAPEAYVILSNNSTIIEESSTETKYGKTLTFYYDRQKTDRGGIDVSRLAWNAHCDSITSVVFDASFAECTSITDTQDWFFNCGRLTSITDIQYLNTENVLIMSRMFQMCSSLTSLDLSHFNTAKVDNMSGMFSGCQKLESLDISNFNTSGVTEMSAMFSNCSALTSLDLSSFNTSGVTKMDGMFYGCFELNTIYVGNEWSTSVVGSGENMFNSCNKLVGGAGTSYDYSHNDITYAHIDGGTANPGYLTDIADKAKVNEAYAVLSDENTVLTFYYDKRKTERNGMDITSFSSSSSRPWNSAASSITTVVFDASFGNYTGLTMTYSWFQNCSALTTIAGIENLKTDKVRNMSAMFSGCTSLTSLNLNGFKTDKVTDMTEMFYNCSSLTSLDLTSFNTANVTSMRSLFSGCSSLTSLDLSSEFKTDNVPEMTTMFGRCPSLTSLDLSSFNTGNVQNMGGMFSGCENLATIYVGDTWSTAAVTVSDNMFVNCTKLVGGAGTVYDADHVDASYAHIDGGTSNPGYLTDIADLGKVNEAYAVLSDENTKLTFYYDKKKEERNGMSVGPFDSGNDIPWVNNMSYISSVVFDSSFADCRPTSTAFWFMGLRSLATITGLENLNTSEVTDMKYMFQVCSTLTDLDLSNFNTENVITMECMFYGCSGLTNINLSSFRTSSVTNMNSMFRSCSALTSINLNNFITENTTDLGWLFANCSSLTSIDLSTFNTERVTVMSYMFTECSSLRTIYVGDGWSINNVTSGTGMFTHCNNLVGGNGTTYAESTYNHYDYAHIDGGTSNPGYFTDIADYGKVDEPYAVLNGTTLTFYYDKHKEQNNGMSVGPFTSAENRGWNDNASSITSVVFDSSFANDTTLTSTAYWFSGCSNLTTITGIKNLKTDNVTNMTLMFLSCTALTSLDLSNFNTANVTDMSNMFVSCLRLTNLDVSKFNTANVTSMYSIFNGCSGLTSLDLSNFNTANVTDMGGMFSGCSSLTTIYAGIGWSTTKVENSSYMFSYCSSLVGGAGTVYDADHVDATYAHIDGGSDNPGYFTLPLSMGDANGDGSVNVADAVATVTHILGETSDGNFYRYAADMNNDSVIDIFDVTLIVNAALNANKPAPALTRGSIDYVPAEAILLASEGNNIYMGMDQAQQYTAFQFDIDLPEGTSLVDVKLAGMTDHQMSFVKRGANQYRVVALSMSNEVLRPTNGHVIQLQVSNTAGESNVKVSNVLFVTPFGKTVTGIGECLNTTMATDGNIYNLRGEKIGKPKQQLGKGIYIMNHKKVIIK